MHKSFYYALHKFIKINCAVAIGSLESELVDYIEMAAAHEAQL